MIKYSNYRYLGCFEHGYIEVLHYSHEPSQFLSQSLSANKMCRLNTDTFILTHLMPGKVINTTEVSGEAEVLLSTQM